MQVGKTNHVMNAQTITMRSVPKRELSGEERQAIEKSQTRNYDTVSLSANAKTVEPGNIEESAFTDVKELVQYLRENYSAYKNGLVTVSNTLLRDCLNDPDKLSSLEQNLKAIPGMLEDIKKNLPKNGKLNSFSASIDADGNMTTQVSSSVVNFNASKRAAELSGAMKSTDVGMVLAKLQQDLSEVKAGGCDEDTIAQVKRMIRKAEQKLQQLKEKEGEDSPASNTGTSGADPSDISLALSAPPEIASIL